MKYIQYVAVTYLFVGMMNIHGMGEDSPATKKRHIETSDCSQEITSIFAKNAQDIEQDIQEYTYLLCVNDDHAISAAFGGLRGASVLNNMLCLLFKGKTPENTTEKIYTPYIITGLINQNSALLPPLNKQVEEALHKIEPTCQEATIKAYMKQAFALKADTFSADTSAALQSTLSNNNANAAAAPETNIDEIVAIALARMREDILVTKGPAYFAKHAIFTILKERQESASDPKKKQERSAALNKRLEETTKEVWWK